MPNMKTFRKLLNLFNFHVLMNHHIYHLTMVIIGFLLSQKLTDNIIYATESDDVSGYGRWSKSEQIFLPAKTYKDIDVNLTKEKWENNQFAKEDTIYNRIQDEFHKNPSLEELKKSEEHMRQLVLVYLETLKAKQAQSVQPMESIQPARSSPTLSLFGEGAQVDDFITQMKTHFISNPYDSQIFKAEIGTLINEFSQTLYNQGVGESLQLVIDKLPEEALSNDVNTKGQVRSEFVEYVKQQFSSGSADYKYYVAAFRAVLYIYNQMIVMPDTLEAADEIRIFNERLQLELQN